MSGSRAQVADADAQIIIQIAKDNLEAVPQSTHTNYAPKIAEWTAWANGRWGNDIVSGPRILIFLEEMVHGRVKKRKRKAEAEGSTVGERLISGYKSAITFHYNLQVSNHSNNYAHPKEDQDLKNFISRLRKERHAIQRENLEDRGKLSIIDGYHNVGQFTKVQSPRVG